MTKDLIEVALPMTSVESAISPYDQFLKVDLDRRVMLINEKISECCIDEQVMSILRWNCEDRYIPVEDRLPIFIFINSEGGSCFDGQPLIDVIRASKTKVITVGLGMVASMAYLIYLAGHERISFANTCFLQHEGETGLYNASSKARDTMAFLDAIEIRNKKYILERTKITEEKYDEVYKKEWWIHAQEAKEYGIVDKIIGEDCDIDILC